MIPQLLLSENAFCMGNALVVGIPHRIGIEIARDRQETSGRETAHAGA